MTIDICPFEHSFLAKCARVINGCLDINRGTYDSSMQPGPIEWE